MNKEELVKEISKKTKLSQKVSSDVLSATLEIIQKTVAKGKKVTLVGFGTWEARKRAARTGRNPQTGKELKTLTIIRIFCRIKLSTFSRTPLLALCSIDIILISFPLKVLGL